MECVKGDNEMPKVKISGIGIAERRIVEIILESNRKSDRVTVDYIKKSRKGFDIRGLALEMEFVVEEKKQEARLMLIESGMKEDEAIKTVRNVQPTWNALLEESENEDGTYGKEYDVDGVVLAWLLQLRDDMEMWTWKLDGEGNREAVEIPSGMSEAIANFDDAVVTALGLDSK